MVNNNCFIVNSVFLNAKVYGFWGINKPNYTKNVFNFSYFNIKIGNIAYIAEKSRTMINKQNSNNVAITLSHIDMDNVEFIERYGDDLIFIRNPKFKHLNHEPYKTDMTFAVICEEGWAKGAVNLRQFCLQKNSMLIVLSSHITEAFEESEDFKGTYVFMSERFLSRLEIADSFSFYESVDENPLLQCDDQTMNALMLYVDLSVAILRQQDKNPNTGEAIRLLTRIFFLMMAWFIHPSAIKKETESRPSIVTHQFLELVKHNYREHRDVEFYADKMNISAKYMSTLVKQASGKSAIQWIENYVILDAKAQLASTANSIQQITYDLNFPTQSIFGRYFKRSVGMSPKEYRDTVKSTLMERTD